MPAPSRHQLTELLDLDGAGTWLAVAVVTPEGSSVEQVGRSEPDPSSSPERLFDLASLTKLYTATGVLELASAAEVGLDHLASDYLFGDITRIADCSIRDLLAHRGGFPPHVLLHELDPFRHDPTAAKLLGRESVLAALVRSAAAARRDRRDVRMYNNISYVILGEILATKKPWTVANALYARVGLASTLYNPLQNGWPQRKIVPTELDDWRPKRCWGEVHDETCYLLDGHAGHAGLFATVSDVAEFTRRWITNDPRLHLSPALHSQALACDGLGIFRTVAEFDPADVEGLPGRALGVTGFTGTSIWIDTHANVGCVILTNRIHAGRRMDWIRIVRRTIHGATFKNR
ncbi:MAG: serine hydrolase [Acidimicrobiia bacterium]